VDWACDVVIGPGAGVAKGHDKEIGKGVYRPPESSSSCACEDLDLIRMMIVFVAVSTLPKTTNANPKEGTEPEEDTEGSVSGQ